MADLVIRPRTEADIPALAEVLAAQRALTRYPMRWPLPFPIEQFIVRSGELGAWTAELGDRPVGHVAVLTADVAIFLEDWQRAHALGASRLAVLSVLFVHPDVRRSGLGRRLHDVAVDWMRSHDLAPCLDVVPVHEAATRLYEGAGWREVGRGRPHWLPEGEPDVVAMVLPVS